VTFENEKRAILKQLAHPLTGAVLAGGALTATFTGASIKDFDLYFRSKGDFCTALEEAYAKGFWCVSLTSRSITFKKDDEIYQLMFFRWFADPAAIFDSFDFTCCMAVLDLDSKEFTLHERFLIDASRRELVFNYKTDFPLASGMRVYKYQERGYSIQRREWIKLIAACSMKKISSWEELKDQIGGSYGDVVAMQTGKEFTLPNICESIDGAHFEAASDEVLPAPASDPVAAVSEPVNYEDAITMIFRNR
jgi:hypothetical protein